MSDGLLTMRRGGPGDLEWLLRLFDEAVAWMVARGQPEQWGTEPWSSSPRARTRVAQMCAAGGLHVAARNGEDAAALIVGKAPAHVPAVPEPELYIELLLVSRRSAGQRIGERLVSYARDEATKRHVSLLRVDCWAGAPTLVAWYEARGFVLHRNVRERWRLARPGVRHGHLRPRRHAAIRGARWQPNGAHLVHC